MSRFSDNAARIVMVPILVLLAGGACAPAARAAIESTSNQVADLRSSGGAKAAGTAAAPGAPPAATADVVRGRPGARNVLRCWQFGRLIYEGQGVMLPDRQAASMKVAGGGSEHLLDLQSATCILEQTGG